MSNYLDEAGLELLWAHIIAEMDKRYNQDAIVQEVITTLGTPVFGTISSTNNIILTGALVPGTYTVKYEDSKNQVIEIGNITITGSWTNMIPSSINSDGTEFIGTNGEDGYKTGYRLNSSGTETEASGINVTGYIPVNFGDTIYIKNMGFIMGEANKGTLCYVSVYDSNFSLICGGQASATLVSNVTTTYIADSETNQLISFTLDDSVRSAMSNAAYIRMSYVPTVDEPILSINEPIYWEEGDDSGNDSETTTPTNLIPTSINSDGSEYIGANGEDGYKVDYRLNSSGVETAATGVNVTGYMPVKAGDTVYIKNISISKTATGGMNDYTYLSLYDANFTLVSSTKFNNLSSDYEYLVKDFTTDENGYVTSFYVQDTYDNIGNGYMRISAVGIDENSIITVNTPIE